MRRDIVGVVVGGIAGSGARWAFGEFGWSTATTLLVVNTLGCLALGAVVRRWSGDAPERRALGIGLCGGLTTFSGLAVELAARLDTGDGGGATALLAASFTIGTLAFLAGRAATPEPAA